MKGLRVGVDIDDVLYPWWRAMGLWRHVHRGVPLETMVDLPSAYHHGTGWYDDPAEFEADMVEAGTLGGILLSHPPMDDVTQLQRLVDAGHEVRLVTARNPRQEDLTRRWVEHYRVPHHAVVHTKAKGAEGLDWHLDDALHHVDAVTAAGGIAVVRDQPWNRGAGLEIPPYSRVSSLAAYVDLVLAVTEHIDDVQACVPRRYQREVPA